MEVQRDSFSIRVTKSRLEKGLLAIPKKHADLFPTKKSEIKVVFDDQKEEKFERKSYLPDDKRVKENRIFGLGHWFALRGMKPGDRLTISVLDKQKGIYRLALDRHIREQQEKRTQQALTYAPNEEVALEQFELLAQITKRGRRRTAKEALLEISRETSYQLRSRGKFTRVSQLETVNPAIRVLLGELHLGKCQICTFTFKKSNGEPYFEVHHLEPEVGDHPANLLVLCPNCHAKFEHAVVEGFERVGGWLVAVRINGKRFTIRQPLRTEELTHISSILLFVLISVRAGLNALSVSRT